MEGLTRADNSTQTGLDIEISRGGRKEKNNKRFHLTSTYNHILVLISFYICPMVIKQIDFYTVLGKLCT